jgi:hypothetical protein
LGGLQWRGGKKRKSQPKPRHYNELGQPNYEKPFFLSRAIRSKKYGAPMIAVMMPAGKRVSGENSLHYPWHRSAVR